MYTNMHNIHSRNSSGDLYHYCTEFEQISMIPIKRSSAGDFYHYSTICIHNYPYKKEMCNSVRKHGNTEGEGLFLICKFRDTCTCIIKKLFLEKKFERELLINESLYILNIYLFTMLVRVE